MENFKLTDIAPKTLKDASLGFAQALACQKARKQHEAEMKESENVEKENT